MHLIILLLINDTKVLKTVETLEQDRYFNQILGNFQGKAIGLGSIKIKPTMYFAINQSNYNQPSDLLINTFAYRLPCDLEQLKLYGLCCSAATLNKCLVVHTLDEQYTRQRCWAKPF